MNGAAVASCGAGITLAPGDAAGDAIAAAVTDLLGTPSYRDAAERLRTTIAAMPSPDEVATVLEQLVHAA